jgi:vacuolar-type H+-ATPase subunit F/Vma7
MSSKICFIGVKDTVDMWRAFGIDVFYSDSTAITRDKILQAVEKKYELIYVAGKIDDNVFNEIERLNNSKLAVITILPAIQPSEKNWADETLKHLSIKAVGSSIK